MLLERRKMVSRQLVYIYEECLENQLIVISEKYHFKERS